MGKWEWRRFFLFFRCSAKSYGVHASEDRRVKIGACGVGTDSYAECTSFGFGKVAAFQIIGILAEPQSALGLSFAFGESPDLRSSLSSHLHIPHSLESIAFT
jgi:hypothetical protein